MSRWYVFGLFLLVTCAIAAGVAGFYRLVSFAPNDRKQSSVVGIRIDSAGFSAQEMERSIVMPVEDVLGKLDHCQGITSIANDGSCSMWVEFSPDAEMEGARQAVFETLSEIQEQLPEASGVPLLLPAPSGSILLLGIASNDDGLEAQMDLRSYGEFTLRKRFLSIPGVAGVEVVGGSRKEIRMTVDTNKLDAFDLTLTEVHRAIQENTNGINNEPVADQTLDDLGKIAVRVIQGTPVHLRDVAAIRMGSRKDEPPIAGIVMAIQITPGANVNQLGQEIEKDLKERPLPPGVSRSTSISDKLLARMKQELSKTIPPTLFMEQTSSKHWTLFQVRRPDLTIKVEGNEAAELAKVAKEIEKRLQGWSELGELQVHIPQQTSELHLEIDPEKSDQLGSVRHAAQWVAAAHAGRVVATLHGKETVDVVLQIDSAEQERPDLGKVRIRNIDGQKVPLDQFVKCENRTSYQPMIRENKRRVALVHCQLGNVTLDEIKSRLEKLDSGSCKIKYEPRK